MGHGQKERQTAKDYGLELGITEKNHSCQELYMSSQQDLEWLDVESDGKGVFQNNFFLASATT